MSVSLLALAAITLLAFSSRDSMATASLGQTTQLDGEEAPAADAAAPAADAPTQTADKLIPPALQGFAPHMDKIKIPTTWHAIRETFGMHLDWAFFIGFLGFLTWAYVRYIRPKLARPAQGEEGLVLDENDLTASLHLVPGEEIFFHDCEDGKEGNVGFMEYFGGSNRVSKLAITNRRVVAQFREATFCGTCQVPNWHAGFCLG